MENPEIHILLLRLEWYIGQWVKSDHTDCEVVLPLHIYLEGEEKFKSFCASHQLNLYKSGDEIRILGKRKRKINFIISDEFKLEPIESSEYEYIVYTDEEIKRFQEIN